MICSASDTGGVAKHSFFQGRKKNEEENCSNYHLSGHGDRARSLWFIHSINCYICSIFRRFIRSIFCSCYIIRS